MVLYVAWALEQGTLPNAQLRSKIAAIKVIAAGLQSRVVERAMQAFGASRHELARARARQASSAAYFTTPEQTNASPRIR